MRQPSPSGEEQSSRLPVPRRVAATSVPNGCPHVRLGGRSPVTSLSCSLSGGRSTRNWLWPFERSFKGICLPASTRYLIRRCWTGGCSQGGPRCAQSLG
eukprot:15922704-Heterocapsa_arctica.AAC.1